LVPLIVTLAYPAPIQLGDPAELGHIMALGSGLLKDTVRLEVGVQLVSFDPVHRDDIVAPREMLYTETTESPVVYILSGELIGFVSAKSITLASSPAVVEKCTP
jgi:hypothetical protein